MLEFAKQSGFGVAIAQAHYAFEVEAEKLQSKNLRAIRDFSFKDTVTAKRYVNREVGLIPKQKQGNMIFIGAGPLPYSAVFSHQLLGQKMAVCDCDEESMDMARRFLKVLGLEDQFAFVHGLAQDVDLSSYDIIWLAQPLVIDKPEQRLEIGPIETELLEKAGIHFQIS